MGEYPIIGKLFSWPLVVGFVLGIVFVCFIVYPPSVNWGADEKWGDVATWVGAIGSILAAGAAAVAAAIALNIANKQAAREDARSARRAETHAAYIFNEVVLVYQYLDVLQSHAARLGNTDKDNTWASAKDMVDEASQWSNLLARIPVDSVSELPEACAPSTAGAISSCRMLVLQATTILNKWTGRPEDVERINRMGRVMVRRCIEIRTNFQPYLTFAKETFGSEME